MITKFFAIKHDKHEIDATDQILGRLSTKIANLLMGKAKSYYVSNLDCGDFVTVTNGSKVKVTGKKESDKIYTRYSGYPGGIRRTTLGTLRLENPTEIIHHSVSGMLPNNKLKKFWLNRLEIHA